MTNTEFNELQIDDYNINARPTCINNGCNTLCMNDNTQKSGLKEWKPLCCHCYDVACGRKNKKTGKPMQYKRGVTPFKKNKCENTEGFIKGPNGQIIPYKCITHCDDAPAGTTSITELDHIDGNHDNNVPSNIQELCGPCHRYKSKMCGDYAKKPRLDLHEKLMGSWGAFKGIFEMEQKTIIS